MIESHYYMLLPTATFYTHVGSGGSGISYQTEGNDLRNSSPRTAALKL
jgi:hypothetical protein